MTKPKRVKKVRAWAAMSSGELHTGFVMDHRDGSVRRSEYKIYKTKRAALQWSTMVSRVEIRVVSK